MPSVTSVVSGVNARSWGGIRDPSNGRWNPVRSSVRAPLQLTSTNESTSSSSATSDG
jgi:hypothetical protein